jgi:hypothetical protein
MLAVSAEATAALLGAVAGGGVATVAQAIFVSLSALGSRRIAA